MDLSSSSIQDVDGFDDSAVTSYQWLRNGEIIPGANQMTYTLTSADVGKSISIKASYTDLQGTAESMTSSATALIVGLQSVQTDNVTTPLESEYNDERTFATSFNEKVEGYLSNTTDVDWYSINVSTFNETTTVTFDTSTMNFGIWDVDWYSPDMTQLSGRNIGAGGIPPNMEAAKVTYDLYTFQPGTYYLRVQAFNDTFYNGGFYDISVIKPLENVVIPKLPENTPSTGDIKILGDSIVGQYLSLSSYSIQDVDGFDYSAVMSYQWLRNGEIIPGENQVVYMLTAADVGKSISLKLDYADLQNHAESMTSNPTQLVVIPTNYPPTGNVTIFGTASQNKTLTASNTLADANGLGTVSYQWLREGVAVTGANQTTYALTQSDVGKKISVTASYVDSLGNAESVTSDGVGIVNVNDLPTGSVVITGDAQQGKTLTASNALADLDGLGTISYQWLSGDTVISGANQTSYTLTAADVNKVISVKASYTDLEGTAESVTSTKTQPVTSQASSKPTNGDDKLIGTAKNDTLNGGLGFDELTGGKGVDKFVYKSIKDAPVSHSKIEIITDFLHSEKDKIDLSGIDADTSKAKDQAFSKPEMGAEFSGVFTKAGQLFFDTTTHILYGNVNADATADFAIQLNGVTNLVATDFIL